MMKNSAIPVVMYHSVGKVIADWKWSFLTVPGDIFEKHLQALAKSGFKTVGLNDLYLHVSSEKILEPRSVVLTFDDGYLDNWTYVAPLLKKYGFEGTVFVNPDFVTPEPLVRPTLEDVWAGLCAEEELEVRGFMSWAELKKLTECGPLTIEAHAMTHTWYPSGPRIVDFHHPDDGYYWLDWNAHPDSKYSYLKSPGSSNVPYGHPVYEHQKSLAGRRYFPASAEADALVNFVYDRGGDEFFDNPHWRIHLEREVQRIRARNGCSLDGRYETESEFVLRIRHELWGCRDSLKEQLGKEPEFFCWPGGGYSSETRSLALECYKAVTLSSSDLSTVRNRSGETPQFIRRLGVPAVEVGRDVVYMGGSYLVNSLLEFQGSTFARRRRQLQKLIFLVKSFIRRKFSVK